MSLNKRAVENTRWPFAEPSPAQEDASSWQRRMLVRLGERRGPISQPPPRPLREFVALGLQVNELRRERGLSLAELARRSSLDPAFLAILEEGKALSDEVTDPVLKALAKGLRARIQALEEPLGITYHQEDLRGLLARVVVRLSGSMQPALAALKSASQTPGGAVASEWIDDELAGISYALGYLDWEEAFRRAIEIDAGDAGLWQGLGYVLSEQGNYTSAEEAFRHAPTLNPQDATAWIALGSILTGQRRDAEGEEAYRQALTVDPEQPAAWQGLGKALGTQGKYVEAEKALRRAVALDPRHAAAWCGMGATLLGQTRYLEAEEAFRHALTLGTQGPTAWQGLGIALARQGRTAEAKDAIGKVIRDGWHLAICELRDPKAPLTDWNVSLRLGLTEIAAGRTDVHGRFTLPVDMAGLPAHARLVLMRP